MDRTGGVRRGVERGVGLEGSDWEDRTGGIKLGGSDWGGPTGGVGLEGSD